MSDAKRTGAVLLGGAVTGLSGVRALAAAGVPVVLVVTDNADLAYHSRWPVERHILPAEQWRPEPLLAFLERHAPRWRGWAIIPMNDLALELLAQIRDPLSGSFAVTVPALGAVRQLLSKDLTYQAAGKVGVDIPRIYGPAETDIALRGGLNFPVVVKPNDSRRFVRHFNRKLFVARDDEELRDAINRIQHAGVGGQIQDLVPGTDDAFYNYSVFLDARGDPVAELGMHKLRKTPPHFGVARVAEVAALPMLREPTIALLRRIGWHGMANAEYKLDPRDGRYRLMEINGRGFLMQGLARRAGVNYPLLAWQEAVLGRAVKAESNGWGGVWIDLFQDLYYGALFRRTEGINLGAYLSSYCRPKTYAVWSASDPKPFLTGAWHAMCKAGSLAFRSGERARLRQKARDLNEAAVPQVRGGAEPDGTN